MARRVVSSPEPANLCEQIDAASLGCIAGCYISFGCTRQDPLSSIAEDPLSQAPTDRCGQPAALTRMFHQSLPYGPGGASDRAIWAFLMA